MINALTLHIKSTHDDLGISCYFCKKSFANLHSYKKNHKNCKNFGISCLFCKKTFVTVPQLKQHQHKCSRDPTICNKCGKGPNDFKTLNSYQEHMKHHEKEAEQFECDFCFKRLSSKKALKVHIDTLHKDNNYKCEQCYKVFAQKGNLQRHKITHENPNDFGLSCLFCKKFFDNFASFKIHESKCNKKPYDISNAD